MESVCLGIPPPSMQLEDALAMIADILQGGQKKELQSSMSGKPMRSSTWAPEEDEELVRIISKGEYSRWEQVARQIAMTCNTDQRTGVQVSQHWRRVIQFRVGAANFSQKHDSMIREGIAQNHSLFDLSQQLDKTELELRLRAIELGALK